MHANTFFLRCAPSACERPIRVVLLPSPVQGEGGEYRGEGGVGRQGGERRGERGQDGRGEREEVWILCATSASPDHSHTLICKLSGHAHTWCVVRRWMGHTADSAVRVQCMHACTHTRTHAHTHIHNHTHQGNAEGIIKLLHDNADECRDEEQHNEGVLELKRGRGGGGAGARKRGERRGEETLLHTPYLLWPRPLCPAHSPAPGTSSTEAPAG